MSTSPYHNPYSGTPPSHLALAKPIIGNPPLPLRSPTGSPLGSPLGSPRPITPITPGTYSSPMGVYPPRPITPGVRVHTSPMGVYPPSPRPMGVYPPSHSPKPGTYSTIPYGSPRPLTPGFSPRAPYTTTGAHGAVCTCPCGMPGSKPLIPGMSPYNTKSPHNTQPGLLNNITGVVSSTLGGPSMHSQPGFFGMYGGNVIETDYKKNNKKEHDNYKSDNMFTKNLYM